MVIYKPNDIENSSKIWSENGRYFLGWTIDESTTRKGDRIFTGEKEISELEYYAFKAEWKSESDRIAKVLSDKKIADNMFESYINSLPVKIGELERGVGYRDSELYDEYGNYIITIPKKAASENWTPEQVYEWVCEMFEEETVRTEVQGE